MMHKDWKEMFAAALSGQVAAQQTEMWRVDPRGEQNRDETNGWIPRTVRAAASIADAACEEIDKREKSGGPEFIVHYDKNTSLEDVRALLNDWLRQTVEAETPADPS